MRRAIGIPASRRSSARRTAPQGYAGAPFGPGDKFNSVFSFFELLPKGWGAAAGRSGLCRRLGRQSLEHHRDLSIR
jgi:hypothetical protein